MNAGIIFGGIGLLLAWLNFSKDHAKIDILGQVATPKPGVRYRMKVGKYYVEGIRYIGNQQAEVVENGPYTFIADSSNTQIVLAIYREAKQIDMLSLNLATPTT
jgi:hypothetical protein